MHRRLKRAVQVAALRPGRVLRDTLRPGYSRRDLRADLMAGAIVGIVALPLSMALAIASGVPPQAGLYTAIVGGAVAALLGGSRVQVTGPTAAFVVTLAPIAARYGLGGLLVATLLAGFMLIFMGMARLGRLIEFVPYPVTAGFTAATWTASAHVSGFSIQTIATRFTYAAAGGDAPRDSPGATAPGMALAFRRARRRAAGARSPADGVARGAAPGRRLEHGGVQAREARPSRSRHGVTSSSYRRASP